MFLRLFLQTIACALSFMLLLQNDLALSILDWQHALPASQKLTIAGTLLFLAFFVLNIVIDSRRAQIALTRPGLWSGVFYGSFAVFFVSIIPFIQKLSGEEPDLGFFLLIVAPIIVLEPVLWLIYKLTGTFARDTEQMDPPDRIVRRLTVMVPAYLFSTMWLFKMPAVEAQLAPLEDILGIYPVLLGLVLSLAIVGFILFILRKDYQKPLIRNDRDEMFIYWISESLSIVALAVVLVLLWNIVALFMGSETLATSYVTVPVSAGLGQLVFVFLSWGIEHRFRPVRRTQSAQMLYYRGDD